MFRSFVFFLGALLVSLSAQAGWEEAIATDDVREVKKLMAAGENVNAPLSRKRSPLILAARAGNIYMVNTLLAAGADMNAKDGDDETALSQAVLGQHLEVVARLISLGADTSSIRISRSDAKLPPIVIDAQRFKLDKAGFGAIAARAFLQRDWLITKREPNRVVGTKLRKDGGVGGVQMFQAEIRYEPPYIIVQFVDGYGYHKPIWLRNLEQDVMVELEVNSI